MSFAFLNVSVQGEHDKAINSDRQIKDRNWNGKLQVALPSYVICEGNQEKVGDDLHNMYDQ